MRKVVRMIKKMFWKLPISPRVKEIIRMKYATIKDKKEENQKDLQISDKFDKIMYIKQILSIPDQKGNNYKEYEVHKSQKYKNHVIAYYLTQYHPNPQNDEWWGKGTTEWTNVSKAVPQYVGHYQPRLPGELGYYDLRIEENMHRQIELAQNYGIEAFCFYYYWFDGERLLERPLDMFLNNRQLKMKFCLCWANENWTRRFTGTNTDVLMKVGDTVESNVRFITSLKNIINDERYYCINGKPVIIVYRPSMIPECKTVISEWRKFTKDELGLDIYVIAVQEKGDTRNWCEEGYDAEAEFQPKRVNNIAKEITEEMDCINSKFSGNIYDYEDLVKNKRYNIANNRMKKVYPAVMPMWDNTARRNRAGIIYHGATPELYAQWLEDAFTKVENNEELEENIVFVNAWNEWGEGAYLEPDRMNGYAYLDATYQVLNKHNN